MVLQSYQNLIKMTSSIISIYPLVEDWNVVVKSISTHSAPPRWNYLRLLKYASLVRFLCHDIFFPVYCYMNRILLKAFYLTTGFSLGFSKKSCCLPQNTKYECFRGTLFAKCWNFRNSCVPSLELLILGSQNRSKNLPDSYSFPRHILKAKKQSHTQGFLKFQYFACIYLLYLVFVTSQKIWEVQISKPPKSSSLLVIVLSCPLIGFISSSIQPIRGQLKTIAWLWGSRIGTF